MKKILISCTAISLVVFTLGCTKEKTQSPSQSTKTVEQQEKIVLISSPVADVHKMSSNKSEKVTQALYGEAVNITEEFGEWTKITLPQQYDYSGWVEKKHLKNTVSNKSIQSKIITSAKAAIYKSPSSESDVIKLLPLGTIIYPGQSNSNKEFISVSLLDGGTGFIIANQVKDFKYEKKVAKADAIIDTAKQLIGVPYLWGGMTNHGVDCSGFTHTVFKVNGIKLHRDADQQYANDGVIVDIKSLAPGDLLFFSTYKPGPSHEGIYVGDGRFIHSSSSQGVGYSSLTDSFYRKKFIGAKRVLS
jgi:gamma-D-glutamyl-L-lysine dipeptidyl-peptidase